jgi:sugar transferase (PEP-CTERM/EpsH1 system associated)
MELKKLLVITSRFPYPLEKGDKLRAYHQIKELSKCYKIYLVSTTEHEVSDEDLKELEEFCEEVTTFRIYKLEKWMGAGISLFMNRPLQIGYFHHNRIHRKIKKYLQHLKPDHIYCQLIRAAEYVKNYHECDKTIDYMDALSKGVERRSDKAKGLKKLIFRSEFRRLLKYENAIFEYFEHHTIISKQDRSYIFHRNRNKIEVIPNGVDESFINFELKEKLSGDLLFTGNMSYPPNITASNYIINAILPLLNSNPIVTIAGADPVKEIRLLQSNQVSITGFVKDVRQYYGSHKVFVAPMFIGTGLQNKLLEAMAVGIPCVTTTLANNALNATPEIEILIADDASSFAKQIERLLKDDELRANISGNAKKFIERSYNWNTVTKELIDLIGV